MKTNVKNLMMLAAAAAVTACSGTDLYDASAVETNQKASYEQNFVKKYPEINLNQSWDYSTKQASYTLGDTNRARTRAGEGSWSKGNWYEVDSATLTWMHEQLVEAHDNRSLGNPFYMTVPGNDFTIVPIYQGVASAVWDLHVVIDGEDHLVWGKSEEIEIKDVRNQEWHSVVQPTYEWGGDGAWWESLFNTDGGDKWTWIPDQGGVRNLVTDVRAIPRTFSGYPVGANMYFYLKIRVSGSNETLQMNNVGAQESSLEGMMLALQNVPRPKNIPEDYEVMIIGCEDADLENSDWDMNDVVFLVYGKKVPQPIKIKEGDPVVSTKSVRYMIEDLGATDDFDFNDIVLDVADVTVKTPVYTNDVLTSWKQTDHYQEATIRHLGGVLPFRLTIGNTQLAERQGVLGADPDETFRVEGWDINRHNVSVQVRQGASGAVYNHVTFPKAGEVPMIIAVDPTQDWMPERQSVPSSWFYIPE